MTEMEWQRHDLVWLPLGAAYRARPINNITADPEAIRLLADWVAEGYPLIVTRQPLDCPSDMIQLGLGLPPNLGKRRLTFWVRREWVERRAVPPRLDRVDDALPGTMQALVEKLLSRPAIRAGEPRLFGSAAMQVITGLPCLGPSSDLDLLLSPHHWPDAVGAVRALADLDGNPVYPRIDGEIRNPSGDAVAWRELALAPAQLLVKSPQRVGLVAYERFVDSFPAAAVA